MNDTSDTTPAGNIFPDFLKREPITASSAADMPTYHENIIVHERRKQFQMKFNCNYQS